MHKIVVFCGLMFILTQCTPTVGEYFGSTTQINAFHTHVVNDSLQLHFKTGADLHFPGNKEMAVNRVKKLNHHPGGLLAYGKTELPPHYEIYLWRNPRKTVEARTPNEIVHDTLIQDQKYTLLCNSLEDNRSRTFQNDCKNIFNTLVVGKNYRDQLVSLFDVSNRFSSSIRYYEAMEKILSYPAKDRNEKWLKLQLALNYASFLAPNAAYDSLLANFERQDTRDSTEQVIRDNAVQGKQQVYKELLNEAETARMVMFNESHFFPNHRILLKELLPKLKESGYDYLALEALGPRQDSLLNAGNKPTLDTGFYTREQHFAELIRTAQKLGFTFVTYENFDQDKNRETGQADNLYRKTIGKDESARVVVLAGMDHILEQPTPNGKSWLGHLLRKKYTLDPLTISQSHLNRYRHLANPVALLPGDRFQGYPYRSVDLLLLNNLPMQDTDPNYTFKNAFDEKVQAAIFAGMKPARRQSYAESIPYRTRLVKPGDAFSVRLPEGPYYMVVFNKNGDVLTEKQIQKNEVVDM